MEIVVGEQGAVVAFDAPSLGAEQLQAAFRGRGQGCLVTEHVSVEITVVRNQRAFETRNRLRNELERNVLAGKRLRKELYVERVRIDPCNGLFRIQRHLTMILQRFRDLLLERLDPAVEEHAALPPNIEQAGRLAGELALVQSPATREAIREVQFTLVAGTATATAVSGEDGIEEELLPKIDLGRGWRIVGRVRRSAGQRRKHRRGGSPDHGKAESEHDNGSECSPPRHGVILAGNYPRRECLRQIRSVNAAIGRALRPCSQHCSRCLQRRTANCEGTATSQNCGTRARLARPAAGSARP